MSTRTAHAGFGRAVALVVLAVRTGEAEECFGAERAETQRLQKDRQRSPVTRLRHRCARIALEKLPQHRDRHLTCKHTATHHSCNIDVYIEIYQSLTGQQCTL